MSNLQVTIMAIIGLNWPSKIKKILGQVHGYSNVLFRSLCILWKISPRETAFLLATLVLQGIIPAVSVWITKQVVDTVSVSLAQEQELGLGVLIALVAAWSGAILLGALLSPWEETAQGNLYEKTIAHFNLLLMQKSEDLPDLSRFEDSHFYDELQFLQQQVGRKPLELLSSLSFGGRALFTTISMLWLLTLVSWWLPILILIATLPQAYVSLQLSSQVVEMTLGKSPQSRRMDYCAAVMLSDTYAKEVRLFQLGPFLINLYQQSFQELHQSMRQLRSRQASWSASFAVLSAGGNAFAFFWIVQQSFQGLISPGNVLLLVQSLTYIQQSLPILIQVSTEFNEILLYMKRFLSFLESQPMMVLASPGKPVAIPMRSGITFDDVCFDYPDGRSALTDVSFHIKAGETVALVGENGAGKTTIVKLLARLYDPTAGLIRADSQDLRELDLETWRRQIAVVFQDFGHYDFTLGENIALGELRASNQIDRLDYAVQQAGLTELVERLPDKYNTLLGKQFGGTELSGGQWQKLALSRAFFKNKDAQVLILDEPTAALDPRSEYDIYHRFAELSQGKTTLLITHRLASVRMADRILVLKAGHIIESGTHEELLQYGGEYTTLWTMQAKQYHI